MEPEPNAYPTREVEMFRASRNEILKRMELQQRTLATATAFAALVGTASVGLIVFRGDVSRFLSDKSVILLPLASLVLEFFAARQLSHKANILLLARYTEGLTTGWGEGTPTWEAYVRIKRRSPLNLLTAPAGDFVVTLGLAGILLFISLLTLSQTGTRADELTVWYDRLSWCALGFFVFLAIVSIVQSSAFLRDPRPLSCGAIVWRAATGQDLAVETFENSLAHDAQDKKLSALGRRAPNCSR